MESHYQVVPCSKIIDAFYKCNATPNYLIQEDCNKIKNILSKSNLTFLELYLKCIEKTRPDKINKQT
jgi:hypothetical protein